MRQREHLSGNVLADGTPDSDPDNDALTVTELRIPNATTGEPVAVGDLSFVGAHGKLVLNATGAYTYTADVEGGVTVGDTVTDVFTYTVSDGHAHTTESTLTVTVRGSDEGTNGDNTFLLTGTGHYAEGFDGDDTYVVDDALDTAYEATGVGTDTVQSGTISIDLSDHAHFIGDIENITLSGTANLDASGNALANVLKGNAGYNVLDGRGGADIMIGGAGNDTYHVDDADDQILEFEGGGSDTVVASVSYSLQGKGTYVNQMRAANTAGDIWLTGNTLSNKLYGNAGNNVLDGWKGADKMVGGAGNDIYIVDNAEDRVYELDEAGIDTVFTSVSFSLKGQYVEKLRLGGTADLDATGNTLVNALIGNDGANRLDGNKGADKLWGGHGDDTFLFTTALGLSNIDTIGDFTNTGGEHDRIGLRASVFKALGSSVTASELLTVTSGHEATTTKQNLIFNSTDGTLWYDSDGKGGRAEVQIATLVNHVDLSVADFLVV